MERRDYRSSERTTQIAFRISLERRNRLKQLAAQHGVSVQTYIEACVFNEPFRDERSSGRPTQPQQELPLMN